MYFNGGVYKSQLATSNNYLSPIPVHPIPPQRVRECTIKLHNEN